MVHGTEYDGTEYLGEVELQWIVSRQRDKQASRQVLGQRVTMIVEEQRVVAERRHGDADLCQVVEVLQHRRLTHTQSSLDPL